MEQNGNINTIFFISNRVYNQLNNSCCCTNVKIVNAMIEKNN